MQKLSQISQTSPKLSPSKKLKPRIISFKISLSLKRTPISFSFFFFNFLIQCNSPSLLGSPSNDFTIYQETSPYIGRVGSYISFKEAIVRKITCFIHYNALAQYQKKIKDQIFWEPHMWPHLATPLPSTTHYAKYLYLLAKCLVSFILLSNTIANTFTYTFLSLSPSHWCSSSTISTIFSRQDHQETL